MFLARKLGTFCDSFLDFLRAPVNDSRVYIKLWNHLDFRSITIINTIIIVLVKGAKTCTSQSGRDFRRTFHLSYHIRYSTLANLLRPDMAAKISSRKCLTWSLGSSGRQSAQSKDDSPLVLLDNLDNTCFSSALSYVCAGIKYLTKTYKTFPRGKV